MNVRVVTALAGVIASTWCIGAPPKEPLDRPRADFSHVPMPVDASRVAGLHKEFPNAILEVPAGTIQPILGVPMTGVREPGADDGLEEIEHPFPNLPPEYIGERWRASSMPDRAAAGEQRATPLMQDFAGPGPNGLSPPDPDLACGPEHVVAVTNDDFAIYDKCGVELFRRDIEDFLGTDPAYLVFDPKVIYDPWNGRWVMLWLKSLKSNEESTLVVVVSEGGTPWGLGGWWWYDFPAVQDAGTDVASWADYYDLGYSRDFLQASGNQFEFPDGAGNQPFRWARLFQFIKSQVYNAQAANYAYYYNLTNPSGSQTFAPRAAKQQVDYGHDYDGVFLNSRTGGSNLITIWKWANAYNGDSLSGADIAVADYDNPPDAQQPDGNLLDVIDSRMMPCVLTYDYFGASGVGLFSSLNATRDGRSSARLYKFDPINNTVLLDWDFWGDGWWYWFASPAADYSGNCYWVFTRTGPAAGREAEMRYVDYAFGAFSNSSAGVMDGTGSIGPCFDDNGFLTGCRWGDYFGGEIDWGDYFGNFSDPGQPMKAWLFAEYAVPDDWRTHVAATSVWSQGNLSAVTPSSTWTITGPQGGPWDSTSRNYTLTNSGQVGLTWRVTSLPSWLYVNDDSGQAYNGDTTVTVFLDVAEVNGYAPGTYSDTITFSDCYNGGNSYNRSVRLVVEGTCAADCDENGTLNIFDFLCFQTAFGNGDPAADCDNSGTLNLFDFLCFQTLFGNGC